MTVAQGKLCGKCGETKLLSEFPKCHDGHNNWCKFCNNANAKAWRLANPERHKASHRADYIKNWKKRNLANAAKRADTYGLPCTITEDDIGVPEICPVLGFPLAVGAGGKKYNSPTIDKIDPLLGYVPGNVWVISNLANAMKQNATPGQLLTFADWVYKVYGGDQAL